MKVHTVFLAALAIVATSVTAAPASKLFDTLLCLQANVGNYRVHGAEACGSIAQPEADDDNNDTTTSDAGTPSTPLQPDIALPVVTPVSKPGTENFSMRYHARPPVFQTQPVQGVQPGPNPAPQQGVQPQPNPAPQQGAQPEPKPAPKQDAQPQPNPAPQQGIQPEPKPEPQPAPKQDAQPQPKPEPLLENGNYRAIPAIATTPVQQPKSNDAKPSPVTRPDSHSPGLDESVAVPTSPEKVGYVVKTPAKDILPPTPVRHYEAHMPVETPSTAHAPADAIC
ncbi:hypothetical protein H4R35_003742 [Dimargaris xerosporica]|nr:hypothetical protein H4R35_003742 [Dimargaris xerosporica]